jgi:hypothetical protein
MEFLLGTATEVTGKTGGWRDSEMVVVIVSGQVLHKCVANESGI